MVSEAAKRLRNDMINGSVGRQNRMAHCAYGVLLLEVEPYLEELSAFSASCERDQASFQRPGSLKVAIICVDLTRNTPKPCSNSLTPFGPDER